MQEQAQAISAFLLRCRSKETASSVTASEVKAVSAVVSQRSAAKFCEAVQQLAQNAGEAGRMVILSASVVPLLLEFLVQLRTMPDVVSMASSALHWTLSYARHNQEAHARVKAAMLAVPNCMSTLLAAQATGFDRTNDGESFVGVIMRSLDE